MTEDNIQARQRWARGYIQLAPDSPPYGSPEWLALEDGAAKVASVCRAAECWALDGDNIEERLERELSAARLADKRAEDAEYVARREAHRREYTDKSYRRHPANLRVVRDDTPDIGGVA